MKIRVSDLVFGREFRNRLRVLVYKPVLGIGPRIRLHVAIPGTDYQFLVLVPGFDSRNRFQVRILGTGSLEPEKYNSLTTTRCQFRVTGNGNLVTAVIWIYSTGETGHSAYKRWNEQKLIHSKKINNLLYKKSSLVYKLKFLPVLFIHSLEQLSDI